MSEMRIAARAIAIAAAALVGCERGPEPAVVRAEGIELRASTSPAAPRVGENELRIELRDAGGRPLEGASVEARVQMQAMGAMPAMGGAVRVTEQGAGRYRADYPLAMGGTWRVELRACRP